jgi:multidrug efflux pump subunit AcrB
VHCRKFTVPLLGSTITPIVVFVPLIGVTGVTRAFLSRFGDHRICVASHISRARVDLTPTLSQYFIKQHAATKSDAPLTPEELEAVEERSLSPRFRRLLDFYEKALRFALWKPKWTAAFALVLVVLSYFCYKALGSDLLPSMDEGGFIVDYLTPPGTSLAETNRIVGHIEQMIRQIPEVEGASRRTGLELGLAAVTEANRGDIAVKLKQERGRSTDEIVSELRAEIARQEPGIDVEFVEVLQDMIGDLSNEPEDVYIKLFSNDPAALNEWAPKVADAVGKVKGIVDLRNGIENTPSAAQRLSFA